MDAIGQENSESLQELLENLPLLEQMSREAGVPNIITAERAGPEYIQEQICEMTGVRPYLLRFWESEFEEIHPQIKEDGQKIYSEADLMTIRRVKELLLDEKLTIERARHLLRKERAQSPTCAVEENLSEAIEEQPAMAEHTSSEYPLEIQMMQDTVAEIEEELNIASQPLEASKSDEEQLVCQEQAPEQNPENNEVEIDRNDIDDNLAKDKLIVKTAFVTRFQKNEVGPGPAGVQLAQDLAIARAQLQQQGLLQAVPQVDTLMEKREQLIQIKNKIESLILELKLKRSR